MESNFFGRFLPPFSTSSGRTGTFSVAPAMITIPRCQQSSQKRSRIRVQEVVAQEERSRDFVVILVFPLGCLSRPNLGRLKCQWTRNVFDRQISQPLTNLKDVGLVREVRETNPDFFHKKSHRLKPNYRFDFRLVKGKNFRNRILILLTCHLMNHIPCIRK